MNNLASSLLTSEKEEKILIVGLGNTILKDEGVGVYIAKKLLSLKLPTRVKIVDCGTDLLRIMNHYSQQEKVIIVDAVKGGKEPGTIYQFDEEELLNIKTQTRSVHQISVSSSIRLLKKLSSSWSKAKIMLIGIEPKIIDYGNDLSSEAKISADRVIKMIQDMIKKGNN